jgi:hypothetical protein
MDLRRTLLDGPELLSMLAMLLHIPTNEKVLNGVMWL